MKNENNKRVNIDFPVSFHLWLEPKAIENERSKRAELKILTTKLMKLNPNLIGLDEELYQGHTRNVKWAGIELSLTCHLWLEERIKESERTKAEELKLLFLWLAKQENDLKRN